MNCTVCGHANREQARYCEECASPLKLSCGSCGAELRAQARFCDQCGTTVTAGETRPATKAPARSARDYTPRHLAEKILTTRAAIEGERKRVTVLFADMKGSQELAEQIDPEEWHGILDRFFGILTTGIHRFEGTINQYTGDGIMALFGAPIAHEDHALRACHAALAVMTELRRFADELRLNHGLSLSMRIGINTGEVVVGRIGDDLRMDYTAQGHTVGLAARMEQIAEPGRIYLTRHTAALVEGYFRLRDLGEMTVKGTRQPLHVYELEGVGSLQTRLDVSRSRGLSRFIGRETESALLAEALTQARAGKGQVVGVVGNAGLGKSRLCHEFTERCRAQGVAVHRATGVPYGSALPFFPILTLMRSYFGVAENDPPAEIRRKAAGTLLMLDASLKDMLPLVFDFMGVCESHSGHATDLPPELQQEKLLEILGILCRADASGSVVIVVEDLHWMDPGSEKFLARMVEFTPGSSTLLLFNYRPEFMADWLTGKIDSEISLSALNAQELTQLTGELLGRDAGMAALGARICERAGGNPFFVEEAVHSLAASGHLAGSAGAYRLEKPVETLVIPDTVQAIIAARIDRLEEREKHVLQHAAVIGREFSREALEKLLPDLPAAELADSLAALEELGFVNQGDVLTTGQYCFCHPLTQEVAYQSQLGEHRARIHARLAADIESGLDAAQPPDERSVLLAHHWEYANQLEKTVFWNIRAGAWLAFRDLCGALARFRKACALTDKPPSPVLQQLAVAARAGILRIVGLTPVPDEEVECAYREARAIVDQTGDKYALAELLIAYGARRMSLGDALAAFENIRDGLRIGREAGARDLEARLRLPILIVYFNTGQLQAGLDLMEESAGDVWASSPITAENVGSRAYRANFLMTMGQLREARRELESAIEVSRQLGRTVSWMHVLLVQAAYFAGATDAAQRNAQTAVRAAEEYDSPFFRLMAYNALGTSHLLHAQWANALEVLERTRQMTEPGQPGRQFAVPHLAGLSEAHLGLGHLEQSLALAREALAAAQEGHMRVWEGRARMQLARALRATTGVAAAAAIVEQLRALQQLIDETGACSYQPFLHEERARLALLTPDVELAQREFERAIALYQEIGAEGRAAALQTGWPARRRA